MTTQLHERPRRIQSQDLLMLKHFREHLLALSDPRVLDLIYMADEDPIANADARRQLRIGRNDTWKQLARLRGLALLEKRGQSYRASPYSRELIRAFSLLFRGVVKGEEFAESVDPRAKELVRYAREGTESLYERGRLTSDEFEGRLKVIREMEAALA